MRSLREIQQQCREAFGVPGSPLPSGVFVDQGIPVQARVAVYRNNASETFRKTLASTYPVVGRLVGDKCFRSLARSFTEQHPSRSGDLQHFGGDFPRFLGAIYDDSDFAYLSDVARLELAIERALLSPDSEPIGIAVLGHVPEHELVDVRLAAVPSLQLVASRFPVLRIWKANQSDGDEAVDLASGPARIAVLRRRGEAEMHPLDEPTFALAEQILEQRSLGEALDAIESALAPKLGDALRKLFDKACIAEVRVDA